MIVEADILSTFGQRRQYGISVEVIAQPMTRLYQAPPSKHGFLMWLLMLRGPKVEYIASCRLVNMPCRLERGQQHALRWP
jgi:hypothetical protein